MTPRVHRYRAGCSWSGSTAGGYDAYDRTHQGWAAGSRISLSADPSFRGDPDLMNPEELMLLAAASCQLLSFLAVAARARVAVVSYEDDATAEMPEDEHPVRITRITLRPRITLAAAVPEERVLRLVEVAHRECFIANSLRTQIEVEPTVLHPSTEPERGTAPGPTRRPHGSGTGRGDR